MSAVAITAPSWSIVSSNQSQHFLYKSSYKCMMYEMYRICLFHIFIIFSLLSILGDSKQLHCHDGWVAIFEWFSDEGRFSSLIYQAVFCFSSKENKHVFLSGNANRGRPQWFQDQLKSLKFSKIWKQDKM